MSITLEPFLKIRAIAVEKIKLEIESKLDLDSDLMGRIDWGSIKQILSEYGIEIADEAYDQGFMNGKTRMLMLKGQHSPGEGP